MRTDSNSATPSANTTAAATSAVVAVPVPASSSSSSSSASPSSPTSVAVSPSSTTSSVVGCACCSSNDNNNNDCSKKRPAAACVHSPSDSDLQRPMKRRALEKEMQAESTLSGISLISSSRTFSDSTPSAVLITGEKEDGTDVAVTFTTTTNPTVTTSRTISKKKKKYRSLLKGIMSQSKPKDVDKERQALMQSLGGGKFEKVAQI